MTNYIKNRKSRALLNFLSKNGEEVSYGVSFKGASGNKSKITFRLVTNTWFLLLWRGWQNLKSNSLETLLGRPDLEHWSCKFEQNALSQVWKGPNPQETIPTWSLCIDKWKIKSKNPGGPLQMFQIIYNPWDLGSCNMIKFLVSDSESDVFWFRNMFWYLKVMILLKRNYTFFIPKSLWKRNNCMATAELGHIVGWNVIGWACVSSG